MVDQILAPPSKTHASLDLIKFVYKQSPRNIDRQNVPASISSSFIAMPKAGSECSSGLLLGNRSCDIGNALFFSFPDVEQPASCPARARLLARVGSGTRFSEAERDSSGRIRRKGEVQDCKTATKKQAKITGLQNSNKEVSKQCIGTDSSADFRYNVFIRIWVSLLLYKWLQPL